MSFNPVKSIILNTLKKRLANLQGVEPDKINSVLFSVDKLNGKLSIKSNLGGSEKPLEEFSEFAEMLENTFKNKAKINNLVFYTLDIQFNTKKVLSDIYFLDDNKNKIHLHIDDVF
jgi:hypothetical protein